MLDSLLSLGANKTKLGYKEDSLLGSNIRVCLIEQDSSLQNRGPLII